MSEAQKILELIENVDPSDTDTLDEIDARVWCWLNDRNADEIFVTHPNTPHPFWSYILYQSSFENFGGKYCTRSRDALKGMRPMAFAYTLTYEDQKGWRAAMTWVHNAEVQFVSPVGWNEELAELHAVIQAIEHERTQEEM